MAIRRRWWWSNQYQQRKLPDTNETYGPPNGKPVYWADKEISAEEWKNIGCLRNKMAELQRSSGAGMTPWLLHATDTEIVRFLRAKHGSCDNAFKMITQHAQWRESKYGADVIVRENRFDNSPIHREVFWMGVDNGGCPTLVIRTQVHDGEHYNEDPKVFTSFVVDVLERGREKYGVGTDKQVCLILDRTPVVLNGVEKVDKFDMSVVPKMADLLKHLFQVLTVSKFLTFVPLYHSGSSPHTAAVSPVSGNIFMLGRLITRSCLKVLACCLRHGFSVSVTK